MVIGTVPIFQGMTAWFVVLEREFGWSRAQLSLAFSLTRAEGTIMDLWLDIWWTKLVPGEWSYPDCRLWA